MSLVYTFLHAPGPEGLPNLSQRQDNAKGRLVNGGKCLLGVIRPAAVLAA